MAKLTKKQIAEHNIAVELLKKDELAFDEKLTVYEKWNESAISLNSEAGAFFTPIGLARDFSLELFLNRRTIDLCAGIGMLSFFAYHHAGVKDITCVELNPIYYEIGKKLLPEATWINASIFDLPEDIGHFGQAISNPPFGKIKTGMVDKDRFSYKGSEFEFLTVEIASQLADYGIFLIPQGSTPFKYSGARYFQDLREQNQGYNPDGISPMNKVNKFIKETGFDYQFGIGIDTSIYKDEWKGVSPICEVVTFDWE